MVAAKSIMKLAPEGGSGKVKNITTGLRVAGSGVGFQVVAQTIDSLVLRGFFNSIGFNLPVLGIRMSLIDLANFLAHNGGGFVPKSSRPFIAVGAAKFTQGTLNLSGLGRNSAGTSAAGTTSSGASA